MLILAYRDLSFSARILVQLKAGPRGRNIRVEACQDGAVDNAGEEGADFDS